MFTISSQLVHTLAIKSIHVDHFTLLHIVPLTHDLSKHTIGAALLWDCFLQNIRVNFLLYPWQLNSSIVVLADGWFCGLKNDWANQCSVEATKIMSSAKEPERLMEKYSWTEIKIHTHCIHCSLQLQIYCCLLVDWKGCWEDHGQHSKQTKNLGFTLISDWIIKRYSDF